MYNYRLKIKALSNGEISPQTWIERKMLEERKSRA